MDVAGTNQGLPEDSLVSVVTGVCRWGLRGGVPRTLGAEAQGDTGRAGRSLFIQTFLEHVYIVGAWGTP